MPGLLSRPTLGGLQSSAAPRQHRLGRLSTTHTSRSRPDVSIHAAAPQQPPSSGSSEPNGPAQTQTDQPTVPLSQFQALQKQMEQMQAMIQTQQQQNQMMQQQFMTLMSAMQSNMQAQASSAPQAASPVSAQQVGAPASVPATPSSLPVTPTPSAPANGVAAVPKPAATSASTSTSASTASSPPTLNAKSNVKAANNRLPKLNGKGGRFGSRRRGGLPEETPGLSEDVLKAALRAAGVAEEAATAAAATAGGGTATANSSAVMPMMTTVEEAEENADGMAVVTSAAIAAHTNGTAPSAKVVNILGTIEDEADGMAARPASAEDAATAPGKPLNILSTIEDEADGMAARPDAHDVIEFDEHDKPIIRSKQSGAKATADSVDELVKVAGELSRSLTEKQTPATSASSSSTAARNQTPSTTQAAAPAAGGEVDELSQKLEQMAELQATLFKLLESKGVDVQSVLGAGNAPPASPSSTQSSGPVLKEVPPPVKNPFLDLKPIVTSEEAARNQFIQAEQSSMKLQAPTPRLPRKAGEPIKLAAEPVTPSTSTAGNAGERRGRQVGRRERGSEEGDSPELAAAQSPRHRRILSIQTVPGLKRFASREQAALDTFHSAALLTHIPQVVSDYLPLPRLDAVSSAAAAADSDKSTNSKSSNNTRGNDRSPAMMITAGAADDDLAGMLDADVQAARLIASELATLLTLQLPRLTTDVLPAVLLAVGQLRAAPKWTWINNTMGLIERITGRFDGPQLVTAALGLARLGAKPSEAWAARFLSETQGHMQANRLDLQHLARLGEAVSEFAANGSPAMKALKEEWLACWAAAVEQAAESGNATSEVAVGVALATRKLSAPVSPTLVLQLLETSLVTATITTNKGVSESVLRLGDVSSMQLAELAPALVALEATPSSVLLDAYIQALWPRLYQLNPAATLSAFNALTTWTQDLPAAMVNKIITAVTSPAASGKPADSAAAAVQVPGSNAAAAAAFATKQASKVSKVVYGSLESVALPHLVTFVVRLDQTVRAAGMQASMDANALRLLQLHVASMSWKDLSPSTVVQLISGVVSLVGSAAAAAAAAAQDNPSSEDAASAVPHVEQALIFAAYKSLRVRLESIPPASFTALCAAVVRTNQVDLEFIESYLSLYTNDTPDQGNAAAIAALNAPGVLAPALAVILQGLGVLATHGTKARPGVLGPLLAKSMLVVDEWTTQQQLDALASMAQMKLSAKEVQGVRVTTSQGIPTPAEFMDAVLQRLQPGFAQLPFSSLADVAHAVAVTGHTPGDACVSDLIAACSARLGEASVESLVSLLSSLPRISVAMQAADATSSIPAQVQAFKEACVEKIGGGVSQLELSALADLMTAVAASRASSDASGSTAAPDASTAAFSIAVLASSEQRMRSTPVDRLNLGVLAQLASSLAKVGAVVPASWLYALQSVSVAALPFAPEDQTATLVWGVAKLATQRRSATPEARELFGLGEDSSDLPETVGISPAWHAALEQRVTQQRIGQHDIYSLEDLARLMWGCGALGIVPRQGLLNSFAGKSMDRLSSLSVDLTMESAWAMAALGYSLGPKWINQWAVAVQGAPVAALDASSLQCTLWALGFHSLGTQHSTPSPVAPLMTSSITAGTARSNAGSAKKSGSEEAAGGAHVPSMSSASAPPPDYIMDQISTRLAALLQEDGNAFTPRQVVSLSATLASLDHKPTNGTVHALATAALPSAGSDDLEAAELAALLWSQARFAATPNSKWMTGVLSLLQPRLPELTPVQLCRLMWALATLKSPHVPSDLVHTCISLLSDVPTTNTESSSSGSSGEDDHVDSGSAAGTEATAAASTAVPKLNRSKTKVPKRGAGGAGNASKPRVDGKALASMSPAAAALVGSGMYRLVPGDSVDCIWSVVAMKEAVPQGWWDLLPGKLNNRMSMLTAPQVSNLLWSCCTAGHKLPSDLANELSKAAATRFASVPPAELADLIFSFASLGLALPPAFASSSVRRLQSSMSGLAPRQLSRMMWSLARSGFTFLPQQLDAYQTRMIIAVPGMSLDDLALIADSWSGLQLAPNTTLLSAMQDRAVTLMAAAAGNATTSTDDEAAAAAAADSDDTASVEGLIPLLTALSRAGMEPSPGFMTAWSSRLTSTAVSTMDPQIALNMTDVLSRDVLQAIKPDAAWCTAFAARLNEALPGLEAKRIRPVMGFLVGLKDYFYDNFLGDEAEAAFSGSEGEAFITLMDKMYQILPDLLEAKMSLLDASSLAEILDHCASLGVLLDQDLAKRITDILNDYAHKLTPQRAVTLCYTINKLMAFASVALEEAMESNDEQTTEYVYQMRSSLMEVYRPLINRLLRLVHTQHMTSAGSKSSTSSASTLASALDIAARVSADVAGLQRQNPQQYAEIAALVSNDGRSRWAVQQREQKEVLKAQRRLDPTSPYSDVKMNNISVVCATREEQTKNLIERQVLVESYSRSGDADDAQMTEYLSSLPATLNNVDALWISDMSTAFFDAVQEEAKSWNRGTNNGAFMAIISGLTSLGRLGMGLPEDMYSSCMDAAAKHFPTATAAELCSFACVLAKAEQVPSDTWLSGFMGTLESAIAREAGTDDSSLWALQSTPTNDLIYALSFWAPKVAKADVISGVVGALTGSGAFPVTDRLGACLLHSMELNLDPAAAQDDDDYDLNACIESLGRMCLISAAQGGRGLSVQEPWIVEKLQNVVMPACNSSSTHPFVMSMKVAERTNSKTTPQVSMQMLEDGYNWETRARDEDAEENVNLPCMLSVLEGLVATKIKIHRKLPEFKDAVCAVLLASTVLSDMQAITRALVAIYKLQLKPSTAWLQYMAAALSTRLDKMDEEYRQYMNALEDTIDQRKQQIVASGLSGPQLESAQSQLAELQEYSQTEGAEFESTVQEYNDQYDSLVKWLTALEKL